MSPFFSIVVVHVPVHAPVRGGRTTLSKVTKQSMSDQLRDRPRTIQVRESSQPALHPAAGFSSYDDPAQSHLRSLAAGATALVVQFDQMLEMRVRSFLSCHELERVQ